MPLFDLLQLLRVVAGVAFLLDGDSADLLATLHKWLQALMVSQVVVRGVEPTLVQTAASIDIFVVKHGAEAIGTATAKSLCSDADSRVNVEQLTFTHVFNVARLGCHFTLKPLALTR